MTNEVIRVLIADDHPIVRQGLGILINSQPDMRLVGEAANGNDALALLKELKPDVIIMDLKMPVMNGLVAIEEIKKSDPNLPILVLTSFTDDDLMLSAVQMGVNGVILKDTPPEQLLNALRDVFQGGKYLDPSVARKLMIQVQRSIAAARLDQLLTKREIEVLNCLAQGMSNREIALRLSISTRTVTTHIRNILDKLGVDNRTQAALYALEHGIVKKPAE